MTTTTNKLARAARRRHNHHKRMTLASLIVAIWLFACSTCPLARPWPIGGAGDEPDTGRGAPILWALEWQIGQLLERAMADKVALGSASTGDENGKPINVEQHPRLQTLRSPMHNHELERIGGSERSQSYRGDHQLQHRQQSERKRRMSNTPLNQRLISLDQQLNAMQSLSTLLDDDVSDRLGRAYKPRTMSTARGFGKRSGGRAPGRWPALFDT